MRQKTRKKLGEIQERLGDCNDCNGFAGQNGDIQSFPKWSVLLGPSWFRAPEPTSQAEQVPGTFPLASTEKTLIGHAIG